MTLLAKSGGQDFAPESLLVHTLAVVEMIRRLCDRLPFSPDERNEILKDAELAAALHDIGKAASGFQKMLRGEQADWNGWRHEALSAGFASALVRGPAEEVVFAVLLHHKEIPGDSKRGLRFVAGQPEGWPRLIREWREGEGEALALWAEVCQQVGLAEYSEVNEVSEVRLRRGWLDDSPTSGQCQQIEGASRRGAARLRGLLISADHLASAHRRLPAVVQVGKFRMNHSPRPFQVDAGATFGSAILRAPTGSGKTEAALLWAGANQIENGRLVYTLPFTAAINAMYTRLCEAFPACEESVGVMHGRAAHHLYSRMLEDYPGDRELAQKEAMARQRLAHEMYHTVRVCTPHQILRHSLHGRGWEQMLVEFPGACVVFDEIHSYQPHLAGLTLGTARLLASQFAARVLFASATLPRFLESIIQGLIPCSVIQPDPSKPDDREIIGRKRHNLQIVDGTLHDRIEKIRSEADAGRKVLVVCNHVRTAQEVYRALGRDIPPDDVALFHSRFNMEDRRHMEKMLTGSRLPRVLVATQVIEVSLDIDFDCGYFEPAPIDALVQRMGRVNRKGTRSPAPVVILRDSVGAYEIYEQALTERTLEELGSLANPVSESEVAAIVDRVYGDGYAPDALREFEERLNHPYFVEFDRRLLAGRSEAWVETVLDGVEGRVDVLPRSLLVRHKALSKEGLWLDADALLVNVRTGAYRGRIDWSNDPPIVSADYTKEGLA